MTRSGNEPIVKTRRMISVLLALFPWTSVWAGSKPPKPPLIVLFAIHKAGTVATTELRIVEHRIYYFDLRLGFKENDPEDKRRVRKLAGGFGRDKNGKLLDPGISIPLKLTINIVDSSGERLLLEKEIREEEMYAYGTDAYLKKISRIALKPGYYRISVESLEDIPELSKTSVSLGIGFNPKDRPID